ncbi:MAG: RND family efflux transporter MFP subunit [Candidatus Peregrinibacteria bacterium Gr01-1014_25]|nr:MAG: RND family efflux transporter MFP subunit [Candidatus Peregrinibacteria bacterium Gr01-1014_25]
MFSWLSRIVHPVRSHPWRSVATGSAALIILGFGWRISQPSQPDYVTAVASLGSVRQTVEAVGTVISERDLQLHFPVSGIVERVLVKEGDTVKTGQTLVALRAGNLSAAVASAAASLRSAQAQLQLLLEGNRPEDIAITQAEFENKQAALEAARASLKTAEESAKTAQAELESLRREASVSLGGDVATAGSTVSAELVEMRSSLAVIDDVFDDVDVQDVLLKQGPVGYSLMRERKRVVDADVNSLLGADLTPDDYEAALLLLEEARTTALAVADVLARSYDVIISLPETGTFGVAERESHKSTLTTERNTIQTSLGTIESALSDLRSASAGYDTKIVAEETSLISAKGARDRALADVRTYETAVRIAQAQLDLKRAGARQADIDAARARVQSAAADLQRAQAQLRDTVLTAPIDGVITKVNVKAGESLSTSFQTEAPVTMLGASPYRVEMYIAEVDIPKVALSQSGSIELDAFRGKPFTLRVGEIAPVATDRDGVPKYRIKLDFLTQPQGVRVGMTGDAEILTATRSGVVSVPLRAVLEYPDGSRYVRVLDDDEMVERPVTIGLDGESGAVEVTGVGSGETIVVLIRE